MKFKVFEMLSIKWLSFLIKYLIFGLILFFILLACKFFKWEIPKIGDISTNISVVFLVVTFVTLLSGRTKKIYWVDLVNYSLVKPIATSVLAISSYIFACLTFSVGIELLFSNRTDMLAFYNSASSILFCISILLISFLSVKLLMSYFGSESVKRSLEKEYLKSNKSKQEKYIKDLLTNTLSYIDEKNFNDTKDNVIFLIDNNRKKEVYEIFDYANDNFISLLNSLYSDVEFCDLLRNKELYKFFVLDVKDKLFDEKDYYEKELYVKRLFYLNLFVLSNKFVIDEINNLPPGEINNVKYTSPLAVYAQKNWFVKCEEIFGFKTIKIMLNKYIEFLEDNLENSINKIEESLKIESMVIYEESILKWDFFSKCFYIEDYISFVDYELSLVEEGKVDKFEIVYVYESSLKIYSILKSCMSGSLTYIYTGSEDLGNWITEDDEIKQVDDYSTSFMHEFLYNVYVNFIKRNKDKKIGKIKYSLIKDKEIYDNNKLFDLIDKNLLIHSICDSED